MLKGVLKTAGKLHIFQMHVCFEANVYGRTHADAFDFKEIDIEVDKKTIKIRSKDKKMHFMDIRDFDALSGVLIPLWQGIAQKTSQKEEKDKKMKKNEKLKTKDIKRTASVNTKGGAAMADQGAVTMTADDWNRLLEGARLVGYPGGDYVVKEGMEHLRIYQIAQGRCAIKKNTPDGGQITLGFMEQGALFGEMTFLEKGKATASVIADSDVQVYIIEGYFINILFVDHPELAGRFYSYLATVLAQRLSDRESQIQRELARYADERRERRRQKRDVDRKRD
jgi:CRP-like cAMP-binding protein